MINIMCAKIIFETNVLSIAAFSLAMVNKSHNFSENYLSHIPSSLVYILSL